MVLRLIVLLLGFLLEVPALGDGMMLGTDGFDPSGLPSQRALIAWKDGEETMVVQTDFTGRPGGYAWVLPVPSLPAEILAVDEDALTYFDGWAMPRREYREDNAMFFQASLGLTFTGLGILAIVQLKRRNVVAILIAGAACTYLIGTVFRPFPRAAGADTEAAAGKVSVLSSNDVGNYKVQVVRSSDSSAMATWLKLHKARMTPKAKAVVDQYVKEGWCFVVAQLRLDSQGTGRPHPLWLTFRSPSAVYPMRLTACQGYPLTLELYVIGDGTVSCPPLVVAESRHARPLASSASESDKSLDPLGVLASYGTTFTSLHADLDPSQMNEDFALKFGPARSFRAVLMKRPDWLLSALATAFAWFGSAFLVVTILAALLELPRVPVVALSVAFSVIVGGVAYGRSTADWSPVGEDVMRVAPLGM
jgi:hypothetical protein